MLDNWLFLVISIGCLLFLMNLAVHVAYALIAVRWFEARPEFQIPAPTQGANDFEPITVPTSGGLSLRGGVYFPDTGHPRGIIVFCPETDAPFETALNYASGLLDSGFALVAVSFRNQGGSDAAPTYRPSHWVSTYEVQDVSAVLDFVQAQPQFQDLPVGLMGISRGAGAALAAGADRSEVERIWAQGPFCTYRMADHHGFKSVATVLGRWTRIVPRWHVATTLRIMVRISEFRNRARYVRLEKSLPKWSARAVMFVCGKRDSYVPTRLVAELCQQSGHDPEDSLWVVPRAKHNQERIVAQTEYDTRLVAFFSKLASDDRSELIISQSIAD